MILATSNLLRVIDGVAVIVVGLAVIVIMVCFTTWLLSFRFIPGWRERARREREEKIPPREIDIAIGPFKLRDHPTQQEMDAKYGFKPELEKVNDLPQEST